MKLLDARVVLFVAFARDVLEAGLSVDLPSESSRSGASPTCLFCLLTGGAICRCSLIVVHDVLVGDSRSEGPSFRASGVLIMVETGLLDILIHLP